MLQENFSAYPYRVFLGNGPGTIFKLKGDFEAHDPVWAKLLFEYGLVGGLLLLIFLYLSTQSSKSSLVFSLFFLIQWLFLGGYLLNFDVIAFYIVYYKLASFY